jgi:DNA primase
MATTIPREFIDEVLAYTDIVDLIDSRVPLKRASSQNMTACCPFHSEKTPSFSVSQSKQFYHCFGCGASGDAIRFLMEYEHQSFVEAIEELAQMAGLEVPKIAYAKIEHKQAPELFELLQQVSHYYHYQLKNSLNHSQVQQYVNQRGLTTEIIDTFSLGFASADWHNIGNAIGVNNSQKIQALFETGMLIQRDEQSRYQNNYYDRFRERLMFPIRDRRGRPIAFGGRILGDGKPKYLNSPETSLFHKGQELYGLYELKQAVRKIERIVVVEGYMDVVSLAQFGIKYSVATLGTATTIQHLQKLFRLCDEIFFCFDGDRAGKKAAWRAMDNALTEIKPGKQVRFMFLPDGEDPDSVIRTQGKSGFEAEMNKAMTFSEFFFDALMQKVNMDSRDDHFRLVDLSKPYLTKIPEGTFQALMKTRLSELTDIDQNKVDSLLGIKSVLPPITTQIKKNYYNNNKKIKATSNTLSDITSTTVRKAITYLLHYPDLAECTGDPGRFILLKLKGMSIFIQLLDFLQNDPHLTTARILSNWRHNEQQHLFLTRLSNEVLLITDEQAIRNEFNDILQLFARQLRQQRIQLLASKEKRQGLNNLERKEYLQLISIK